MNTEHCVDCTFYFIEPVAAHKNWTALHKCKRDSTEIMNHITGKNETRHYEWCIDVRNNNSKCDDYCSK